MWKTLSSAHLGGLMCVRDMFGQCPEHAKIGPNNTEVTTYINFGKKSFLRKKITAQIFLTSVVMLTSASCGMPIGFSAILLPQLKAANSSIHIDEEMGSWIASIHCVATPIGSLLSGILMDKLGRKLTVQYSSVPLILGWILISSALNYPQLLVGRLLAGLSAGLSAAAGQVLIAECTEPNLRGMLSSGPLASYSFGIVLISALGSSFTWRYVAGLSTLFPLVAVLAFLILPESPVFLVKKHKYKEALHVLNWLRGGNILEAQEETDLLIQKVKAESALPSESIVQSFLKPHVLKPLMIINVFNILQVLSGTYTIVFYAVEILSHMKVESVDHFLGALILACVRFFFTVITSLLLLIIGRRTLAMFSGVGTTISAICIAILLKRCCDDSEKLTEVFIFIYVAMNTVGFFVLPGVMLGELFPLKVRGYAGGFSFMLFNISLFLASKTFPFMKNIIGMHGVFWVFGVSSLLATIFLFLVMPETKGQTLGYIENYFQQNNYLWLCRYNRWDSKAAQNTLK